MYKRLRLVAAVLTVVTAAACGSPKPIKYYSIQIPAAPSPSTHTYAVDLNVARVSGSDLLASEPIIYKTSANEIGTYTYHRWTEAPRDMVQTKLVRLLRTSGDYESVTSATSGGGDLTVRGN